ncbi:MAG: hypothetical protein LBC73_06060 [Oscillospiraceae bacterium]|nr:hypothetical protein [Oscillospiraceae bacterium]
MWKRYFGPFVTIVGIDINPKCKKFEESQIHIRIGDQSDPVFLQSIIDEFGLPDIVLDDGSHIQKHVNATYNFLYEKLNINSVYFIEDLGCAYIAYWGGRLNKKDTFIERCKNFINSFYLEHEISTESTESISVYDSIIALEKKAPNVVGQSSIV